MSDLEYKLSDYCEEFYYLNLNESNYRFGCENQSKNLVRLVKKGEIYFKNHKLFCLSCKSHKVIKNGNYKRTLYFLHVGKQICFIQVYKCLDCGKKFVTDMTSLVDENKNVTKPVINCIRKLYSTFGNSIYKIQHYLKEQFKVDLSHQTIENIILSFKKEIKVQNWTYSGYYLFDSLWVKINGQWKYVLTLFDVKMNTIVNYKIVNSESSKVIYSFLDESTRNQKRKYIVTDLKIEYRESIQKLGFKHQFCLFHTKQKINRDINNYLKENKINLEEENKIKEFKQLIFEILNCETIEEAKNCRDNLILKDKEFPLIIKQIMWKFIIPYFKNLTYHLESDFLESTSNKIENFFQKVLPKHIKKTFRSIFGLKARLELKIEFWNKNNLQKF